MKAFRASALAIGAAVPAVLGALPAAAAAGEVVAYADLNGDGRGDKVVLRSVATDPNQQELTATVMGRRYTARVAGDAYFGPQPLRVVDVNADHRAEVVVTEYVGANTLTMSVWDLGPRGLRPLTQSGGAAFKLYEGGGNSLVSRYGCEPAGGGRVLVTVDAAQVDWTEPPVYEGHRRTYSVHNGVATLTSTTPVTGERDAPAFQVVPESCA